MSKTMFKKALQLFRGIRFFCFSIFIFLILVQKSYPLTSTPGLVVLPFAIDSNLVEIRNSFTDRLIQKCKDAGYNTIGTRYLSNVLKMGSCDSDECMRKIASLVGARYVIFGSIKGDTNSYKLSVNFKDLLENKELLTINRLLSGTQASIYYVDELTLLIIQSLNGGDSLSSSNTDSSGLPLLQTAQDSVSEIQPQITTHNSDTVTASTNSDSTVTETADSSLAKSVLADSVENVIHVEKALEKESDTNRISEENVAVIDTVQNLKENVAVIDTVQNLKENVTAIGTEQNLKEENLSATGTEQNLKMDTVSTYSDNIASTSIPGSVYIPPIKEKKSLIKPLPRRLDQQFFRGGRLLVFGNTAIAGLIGGLVMNDRVKKGLDKEAELYRRHENADREHLVPTYESYKRQTEKTDKDSRIRNAMYAVSGVCALGFTISIFF